MQKPPAHYKSIAARPLLDDTVAAHVLVALGIIGRGPKLDGRVLCVLDGGKGIRKAIDDMLGDLAVVQRCQLHKRRNLKDHFPKTAQASMDRMLREAYGSTSAETARKRLRSLVCWLESNGHEDASASLREGMEETLTVVPASQFSRPAGRSAIEKLFGLTFPSKSPGGSFGAKALRSRQVL